jgi:hypothetical protein
VTVVAVRRSLPRLGHHMACSSIDKKAVIDTKTAFNDSGRLTLSELIGFLATFGDQSMSRGRT